MNFQLVNELSKHIIKSTFVANNNNMMMMMILLIINIMVYKMMIIIIATLTSTLKPALLIFIPIKVEWVVIKTMLNQIKQVL